MESQLRRAVGGAVQHVRCRGCTAAHLCRLALFLTTSVTRLTSLDLRGCHDHACTDEFLLTVAEVHASSLRRLYLRSQSEVLQSTLNRFSHLEELDVSGCDNFVTVDFCSRTLRVLYANLCMNLTNEGLQNATRLQVLHVRQCHAVTEVTPFAHCIVELDLSFISPPVDDGVVGSRSALSDCVRLQRLYVENNVTVSTLQPFAENLRELDAGGDCALSDDDLVEARGLVHLVANHRIKTVQPFGRSLRKLRASYSPISEAGLATAINLVALDASANAHIRSLTPLSSTLLELTSSYLDDAALSAMTNLIWLNVNNNRRMFNASCSPSLRHLDVTSAFFLHTDAISTATKLVTLKCARNPQLTTIRTCRDHLEELITDSSAHVEEVRTAPALHHLTVQSLAAPVAELEEANFSCTCSFFLCSEWHRDL